MLTAWNRDLDHRGRVTCTYVNLKINVPLQKNSKANYSRQGFASEIAQTFKIISCFTKRSFSTVLNITLPPQYHGLRRRETEGTCPTQYFLLCNFTPMGDEWKDSTAEGLRPLNIRRVAEFLYNTYIRIELSMYTGVWLQGSLVDIYTLAVIAPMAHIKTWRIVSAAIGFAYCFNALSVLA